MSGERGRRRSPTTIRPLHSTSPEAHSKRRLRRTTRYTPGGIVINRWTKIRFAAVGTIISFCFLGVAVKAYGLQVKRPDYYRELAERQHLRTIEVPAPRGAIYDRNHSELAVNANVDSIYANPRKVTDLAATSTLLAQHLDMDVRDLERRLASKRYFAWIQRHVTPRQANAVRQLDLPGISIAQEPRRFYPGETLAGHLLGFAGIDGQGLDGLELAMDDILAGTKAEVAALRDASGRIMVDDPQAEAQPGASIELTIDRSIQFAAQKALREAVKVNKAKAATAVVIEVETGNVLAIANYPEVDPNSPGNAKKLGARNRALTDSYEVGSVMKAFTVAGALEAGLINPNTVIDTEGGRYRAYGKLFRDSFHDKELSVSGVIKRSSNVGALKIGFMLGADRLRQTFLDFGFGASTEIELPGEVSGVLHPAKRWGDIGLATHSFGYGMTSTPLQVTAAMATLGNKGVYIAPRIVKSVRNHRGEVLFERKATERRVVSESTARKLLPMLESVFEGGKEHGTARSLYVPGHRVGGKTGTAHKYDPKIGGYGDLYLSSFSGLAPIDHPRIAVTVLVDEPHGDEHYGGQVAGPAWTQIVSETLAVLGEPANEELLAQQLAAQEKLARRFAWRDGIDWDKLQRQKRKNSIPLQDPTLFGQGEGSGEVLEDEANDGEVDELPDPVPAMGTNVPDFTGMGLAKALSEARKLGLDLRFEGSGVVVDQRPPPGHHENPGAIQLILTSSELALPSSLFDGT